MTKGRSRGYVEVGQLFGWIIALVILSAGIYYGKILYDAYQEGNILGAKLGDKYAHSDNGRMHGAQFETALSAFLHVNRDKLPDRTFKDKAYNQGWDDGFHNIVDKIPR